MPNLPFQIITTTADIAVFVFVIYYLWRVHKKEKTLEKKENKVDTQYHQIVDDALSRERKILEDATSEADQIITSAEYVNKNSTEEVNQALHVLVTDIEKEAVETAKEFTSSYSSSLKQLTGESLTEFQTIIKELVADLQRQTLEFRQTMLPQLEKELEAYKENRMKQADELTMKIIQKASQDIFNKSISSDDHQKLVMDSLEKAKKEGVFE